MGSIARPFIKRYVCKAKLPLKQFWERDCSKADTSTKQQTWHSAENFIQCSSWTVSTEHFITYRILSSYMFQSYTRIITFYLLLFFIHSSLWFVYSIETCSCLKIRYVIKSFVESALEWHWMVVKTRRDGTIMKSDQTFFLIRVIKV